MSNDRIVKCENCNLTEGYNGHPYGPCKDVNRSFSDAMPTRFAGTLEVTTDRGMVLLNTYDEHGNGAGIYLSREQIRDLIGTLVETL